MDAPRAAHRIRVAPMADNPRGRSRKLLTADEWISAAALLLPSLVTMEIFLPRSDSANERKERLIRATEAMCARCVQLGLPYEPLREFVLILENDLAPINIPSSTIRQVFASAEEVVRTLARMEQQQGPPAPQSKEPISASGRPTTPVVQPNLGRKPRRRETADARDAAAVKLAMDWDAERRNWSLADLAQALGVDRSQLTGLNAPGGKPRSPLFRAYWDHRCAETAARKDALTKGLKGGAEEDDLGDEDRDETRDESS